MAIFDITRFGAVGDGESDNTAAIRATIAACKESGGGTVYVPAGIYPTGRIELISRMTLELEAGAVLLFRSDFESYPPVRTRWSGYECSAFAPLLFGRGLRQIAIKGRGTIDGQGAPWWQANRLLRGGGTIDNAVTDALKTINEELIRSIRSNIVEWQAQFLRPPLLQLIDCEDVIIEGVTLQNSPFWNTHLVYCRNVNVHGVTIRNPHDAPNGDGLDLDSCSYVRVSDCHFDVGDDCLCIKSGIDEDGRRVGKPSENITITGCTMRRGHGGVVMGSEMAGGIRNVVITGCIFIGTDRGIRMKTNRARGGYIRNILVSNVYMEDVFCPLTINAFYRHGVDESDPLMSSREAVPVTDGTPVISHIRVNGVTANNCRASAGLLHGLPEMPITDVRLSDVSIEMTGDPNEPGEEPDMTFDRLFASGEGMLCKHIEDAEFHNVRIDTRQGPALRFVHARNIDVRHFKTRKLHPGVPALSVDLSSEVRLT